MESVGFAAGLCRQAHREGEHHGWKGLSQEELSRRSSIMMAEGLRKEVLGKVFLSLHVHNSNLNFLMQNLYFQKVYNLADET